jgi:uncharacterized protein
VENERVRELILASRRGDTEAFAELVTGQRERLESLVARVLGDGSEAEDVVQETLLRAYLGLSQLRDPERFGAWLAGIALNLARMILRRRAAYARALARVPAEPLPDPREEAELPLDQLPDGERAVVVLHYVEGLSCEEIAARLDRTPGAIRVRLHRARARLRERLQAEEEAAMVEVRVDDVLVRVDAHDARKIVGDQRVILLRETEGERVVPIWIGAPEGNALAFELRGESPLRPMTSDLLAEVVRVLRSRVERVAVTRLEESVFYAAITLAVDGHTEELDARPSDALNLAVRSAAPIVVAADVLETAAVAADEVLAKLEEEGIEVEPGEWRSLSAELLHAMYQPPRRR